MLNESVPFDLEAKPLPLGTSTLVVEADMLVKMVKNAFTWVFKNWSPITPGLLFPRQCLRPTSLVALQAPTPALQASGFNMLSTQDAKKSCYSGSQEETLIDGILTSCVQEEDPGAGRNGVLGLGRFWKWKEKQTRNGESYILV